MDCLPHQATVESELLYLQTKADAIVHVARLGSAYGIWRRYAAARRRRQIEARTEACAEADAAARALTGTTGSTIGFTSGGVALLRAPLVDEYRRWRHQVRGP